CKPRALAALFERLADADPAVAAEAERVIGEFGPFDADREVLAKYLTHDNAVLRRWAVELLDPVAPDAPPARGWFRPRLGAPDPRVRAAAAAAIGRHGPAAKDALPDLLAGAKDPNPAAAVAAVRAIRRVGGG